MHEDTWQLWLGMMVLVKRSNCRKIKGQCELLGERFPNASLQTETTILVATFLFFTVIKTWLSEGLSMKLSTCFSCRCVGVSPILYAFSHHYFPLRLHLFFRFIYLVFTHVLLARMYVCTCTVCAWYPCRSEEGVRSSGTGFTMWRLGIEPGSSGRAASALNQWATFLAPDLVLKLFHTNSELTFWSWTLVWLMYIWNMKDYCNPGCRGTPGREAFIQV